MKDHGVNENNYDKVFYLGKLSRPFAKYCARTPTEIDVDLRSKFLLISLV